MLPPEEPPVCVLVLSARCKCGMFAGGGIASPLWPLPSSGPMLALRPGPPSGAAVRSEDCSIRSDWTGWNGAPMAVEDRPDMVTGPSDDPTGTGGCVAELRLT
mmetsp:Transcript_19307/g.36069  ORF Transcript_19307/g.36069 Transcript_19307/m.36069 type:complete len:103 (-) Transcript_19307:771-1079(-)